MLLDNCYNKGLNKISFNIYKTVIIYYLKNDGVSNTNFNEVNRLPDNLTLFSM